MLRTGERSNDWKQPIRFVQHFSNRTWKWRKKSGIVINENYTVSTHCQVSRKQKKKVIHTKKSIINIRNVFVLLNYIYIRSKFNLSKIIHYKQKSVTSKYFIVTCSVDFSSLGNFLEKSQKLHLRWIFFRKLRFSNSLWKKQYSC